MLGLARKANRLVCGTPLVLECIRKAGAPADSKTAVRQGARMKKPSLAGVYFAADASENTVKKLRDKCAYYGVSCRGLPLDTAQLAHSIGKTACVGSVALTEDGFIRALNDLLDGVPERPHKQTQTLNEPTASLNKPPDITPDIISQEQCNNGGTSDFDMTRRETTHTEVE